MAHVVNLPVEVILLICADLSNANIKSFRLTCTRISRIAQLRLTRVFLSADPTNIRVFRAIADHEKYREQITEIIYDDARLTHSRLSSSTGFGKPEWDKAVTMSTEGCPEWFAKVCHQNIAHLAIHKGQDVDLPHHIARANQVNAQLPLGICWQYYKNLIQQQHEVLISKQHEEAFLYGLTRFPSLTQVTITPATHGLVFAPLYETPMIRAFPYGFNYPIPHGWPVEGIGSSLWEDDEERYKDRWHGFRMVTRVLAQEASHRVTELLIDVNGLPTGLNSSIFYTPRSEEYKNLVTILSKPGFRRLDLALSVGDQEHPNYDWIAFRTRYLSDMLSEAEELEHINLFTTLGMDSDHSLGSEVPGGGGSMAHFIPLQKVFPVSDWNKLRHFQLSRFMVTQSDLMGLLINISATIQTVSLNFLTFLDNGGDYHSLLNEIRDTLKWHEREPAFRPNLIIRVDVDPPYIGKEIWVEKQIHEFLYEGGRNPFLADCPNRIKAGMGMQRVTFEVVHERPYRRSALLSRPSIHVPPKICTCFIKC
ncbi:hypothetical protein N7520_001960 [Penicillium odoratum]|uniref:uncharacterized protein n=1 Tax=Penicillium odoratum TaxID=1167516 RepID=UPI0025498E74|nr:uncharacterized protein N7520_001960 [Penicillium odoratum]KAJ5778714.1 hypothetical protein N7520_001960 [Penicillium odoratum]